MLYLDYAKPLADGKYILSFFADSTADLESISHGQKFVTKNGTDYGVPQAGSTVIVTSPNSGKTTYVMDAEGVWVVTEDISYSAVVANPSDAATAKLEKLKVNDTTYANWTENEIKALAGKGEDGVSVTSFETVSSTVVGDNTDTTVRAHYSNNTTNEFVVTAKNGKDSAPLYFHGFTLRNSDRSIRMSFFVPSTKSTLFTRAEMAEILNNYVSYVSESVLIGNCIEDTISGESVITKMFAVAVKSARFENETLTVVYYKSGDTQEYTFEDLYGDSIDNIITI